MNHNTKPLAWFHFRFRIPAEWEITAYSVEDRAGRLEFSTRKGFQAVVGWEPYEEPPDTQTMMLAFLRRNVPALTSHGSVSHLDLKTENVGRFLVGHLREGGPYQAICHLAEPKKLLHWVFNSYDAGQAEEIWNPILQSFELNDGDSVQYAIYGFNFQLPRHYLLEDMTVLPANVMVAFESRNKARATFRRWGMPDIVLLDRPLEAFYPWFLKAQGCSVHDVQKTTVSGMEAVRASFDRSGEHQMDRFMGRPWKNGEALLWYNRNEMRIYAFEQIGPPKIPLLKFMDVFPGLRDAI